MEAYDPLLGLCLDLIYCSMTGKNFIHKLIGAQIALPANIWKNLQKGWIGFFIVVGFINLAVAYSFSTEAWVNFKLSASLASRSPSRSRWVSTSRNTAPSLLKTT